MEDNFGYLFAGFAIGWGIFMGLAYWIYRRVACVGQDIEEMKRARGAYSDKYPMATDSHVDPAIEAYTPWLSPRKKTIAGAIVIAIALATFISLSIIFLVITREDNAGYLYAGFTIGWGIFIGLICWVYRRVALVSQDVGWLNRARYTHSHD